MKVIYTDGSARGNGSKSSECGFGVVVIEAPVDDSGRSIIVDAHAETASGVTNNRMELEAIIWALENYGSCGDDFFAPIVYSDSQYCVNSFTKWMYEWKRNGWKRAKNKPIENLDLMMKYYDLVVNKGYHIDLRYIQGHVGHIGNELADSLATGKITVDEVLKFNLT